MCPGRDRHRSSRRRHLMVSAQTAEFLKETRETTGALVFGRRTFDLTHGWGGKHPLDVPVFVVSSSVPPEWVYEGSPFTFVTDGLESALAQAKAVAGDKDVGVGAASIVQQCIRAGLLDEIHIDLVPVLHEGDRGRWGDASYLPRREVKYA